MFLGDLVLIRRFIHVYVVPRVLVAWVAIDGSCGPVNMASFIGNIVPRVVTVAIIKLHPFCTRPSATRRQPTHFRNAWRAWKVHSPLDPNGWKWWKTKHLSPRLTPCASKPLRSIPLREVPQDNPIFRFLYPNLAKDFIVAVPDFPGRIEIEYPMTKGQHKKNTPNDGCLLYTSPSPRD